MKQPLLILGAGGLAREIYGWINHDEYMVMGFYSNTSVSDEVMGLTVPVYHSLDDMKHLFYVCAVGDPKSRQQMCELAEAHQLTPCLPIIHRTAIIGQGVTVERGSILCPHVILTTNIRIGRHVLLNLNATVGHDCTVGEYTTISPGANISGNVTIGDHAYIGTNACIREKLKIGSGAVIGMGTTVVKSVPAHSTTIGVAGKTRPLLQTV